MNKVEQTVDTTRLRLGISQQRRKEDGPMSVEQAANLRRAAEYAARRSGIKEALLQLWKVIQ
ncbi:hypothetical protein [Modicisalibacter luteus]|uniref:Uncharacterized protein n=1 Tax=Modicisalibacter luteus TaxID=453962 RepID=A0ABV7M1G3_9GAMM|nr:hypothetical protein [Halomonas lutea]GHB15361.1 hypothetical protein GCM10007159_42060 [Halomonas lutea]